VQQRFQALVKPAFDACHQVHIISLVVTAVSNAFYFVHLDLHCSVPFILFDLPLGNFPVHPVNAGKFEE